MAAYRVTCPDRGGLEAGLVAIARTIDHIIDDALRRAVTDLIVEHRDTIDPDALEVVPRRV
jgi:hypothetical protein